MALHNQSVMGAQTDCIQQNLHTVVRWNSPHDLKPLINFHASICGSPVNKSIEPNQKGLLAKKKCASGSTASPNTYVCMWPRTHTHTFPSWEIRPERFFFSSFYCCSKVKVTREHEGQSCPELILSVMHEWTVTTGGSNTPNTHTVEVHLEGSLLWLWLAVHVKYTFTDYFQEKERFVLATCLCCVRPTPNKDKLYRGHLESSKRKQLKQTPTSPTDMKLHMQRNLQLRKTGMLFNCESPAQNWWKYS